MSSNYADGLSDYEHKGVCGLPEVTDEPVDVSEKVKLLSEMIKNARHVVVHCGAGLSTSAGIPDFRGPNGIWTLEKKGIKKSDEHVSFGDAKPTFSHLALKALLESNLVHFIISQNIDGLFLKTGMPRSHLAELHGNFYLDECNLCGTRYLRNCPSTTMGLKLSQKPCCRPGRRCRGFLRDTILDWEDELPISEIEPAEHNSLKADLSICLGSTLQINPAGNLPFTRRKKSDANHRQVAIVNLQKTKFDAKADLVIHEYIDNVLRQICDSLDIKVREYSEEWDLTRFDEPSRIWI